jgi:nucleoside-diphosphate-sugar epimerase
MGGGSNHVKALVTGAGGFLGLALTELLVARGHLVTTLQRGVYPELERLGVRVLRGDVADETAALSAIAGQDCVFHVAAKAGSWGSWDDYYRANVLGSRSIISACLRAGVPKLVYTSSPSVVFNGRDMAGVDERVPYPAHYEANYPATKAEAERAVLAANGPDLATVALRPHLVWGPRDPHFLPRLISARRAGRLRRIGDGRNLVDATYIDNAAMAHLSAAESLMPGAACAGRAYFIANDEPVPAWDLLDDLLGAADLPPVAGSVPAWLALAGGTFLEAIHNGFSLDGEPRMTRWVARELATTHYFDLTAAKRELGYVPAVSTHEGLKRLAAWCRDSAQFQI